MLVRRSRYDSVIVFVHGVLSDSRGCWQCTSSTPAVYWPDLLTRDNKFDGYSIYLGGFYTAIDAGPYEVADCAQELFAALNREQDGRRAVLQRKAIMFVCHSLGGVVVRYMLESRSNAFAEKDIGILLIASPSYGSDIASRLKLIAEFYKNSLGVQLQWGSWTLRDLDSRFRRLIEEKRIPKLKGIEGCENHFVIHRKWFPDKRVVVTRESAGRYFGPAIMLRNTDHFSCVKPDDARHPAHELLLDFCNNFNMPAVPLVVAAPDAREKSVSAPAVTKEVTSIPRGQYSCKELHWDTEINEEGDAQNEMSFRGVVLGKATEDIELPVSETQAGHISPYQLLRGENKTSEGVVLDRKELGPRKIRMSVQFTHAPTEDKPLNFVLRNYDFNVYCMNMQEFRQKESWREDGIDYLEKLIDEDVGVFSLVVHFPKQIKLTGPPFFEVYQSDSDDKREDQLTSAFQNCFYYSSALQTAILFIRKPPAPFYYRISWVLAESTLPATTSLTPLERKRQRDFSQSLLALKGVALAERDLAKRQLAEKVFGVLAAFAQFIKGLVDEELKADSGLDPGALELSLMVVDDSGKRPLLKIAVGTDPRYQSLELSVGDGNAGRAWKRKIVRVFDAHSTDLENLTYMEVPGIPRHAILFSIPLIGTPSPALVYGILNLGTFSDDQAEVLRVLARQDLIRQIVEVANTYVLTRLLELFKM